MNFRQLFISWKISLKILRLEGYIKKWYPANTIHWNNVVLLLAHRLRHWPSIKPTLVQCVVFAGHSSTKPRIVVGEWPLFTSNQNTIWGSWVQTHPRSSTNTFVTMLDQRRKRWADVVQMLYKCFLFAVAEWSEFISDSVPLEWSDSCIYHSCLTLCDAKQLLTSGRTTAEYACYSRTWTVQCLVFTRQAFNGHYYTLT